jgi:gamma-glutamylcyclotransferase (GGCT)/AIG2-like uncharacterized protein YtfP
VRDAIYPAIIPDTSSDVIGLLLEVTDAQLELLDEFESNMYLRTVVPIHGVEAMVYVWNKPHSLLQLDKDWNLEEFNLLYSQGATLV